MSATRSYLELRLGADRYVIDVAQVAEVIPLVRLKALPGAPPGTAGLLDYHGRPVPVVDLELIATGTPSPARLMTRVVIVRAGGESDAGDGDAGVDGRFLGLLVREVIGVVQIDAHRFEAPGIASDGAPYLGPVLATPAGVIQRVTVAALLTGELRAALRIAAAAA